MECKFAYKKNGLDCILCRKEQEPDVNNQREVSHAMCGRQSYCPVKGCSTMSPLWRDCHKLRVNIPVREQDKPSEEKKKDADKDAEKKKASVKTAETATGKIKNNII